MDALNSSLVDNGEETDENLYLSIMIGHSRFVINASLITGIIEKPHITTIPLMPPDIAGVVNVRGEIIPVHDMRAHFGMTGFEAEKKRTIGNPDTAQGEPSELAERT